jgi:hypothetical protein
MCILAGVGEGDAEALLGLAAAALDACVPPQLGRVVLIPDVREVLLDHPQDLRPLVAMGMT